MRRALARQRVGVCLATATATAACGGHDPSPAGECTEPACLQPAGTGAGGAGTGTGTGGTGGSTSDEGGTSDGAAGTSDTPDTTTVTFSVTRTIDNRFIDVLAYAGPIRVSAFGATGGFVDTGDAGTAMLGMLPGVAIGPNWFAVEDPSGAGNIMPTLEPVVVEPAMLVPLRAIWSAQLMPLVVDGIPWAPLEESATLIIRFTRAATPLSGVTIATGIPAGATVAYEEAGTYLSAMMSNPDISTDGAGVAVVRDIEGAGRFPAPTTLSLTYRVGSATLPLQPSVAQGFVTWMAVEVP